jgi:hypothetical protein
MSTVKVVRYRTKPEQAEANAELVRAVFAELAAGQPAGLRYGHLPLGRRRDLPARRHNRRGGQPATFVGRVRPLPAGNRRSV